MFGIEGFEEVWTAPQLQQVTLIVFVMLAWTLLFGIAGFWD